MQILDKSNKDKTVIIEFKVSRNIKENVNNSCISRAPKISKIDTKRHKGKNNKLINRKYIK